jgi:NAD(P)-dependent dehydrogenase (short-subunit alcohol dehydrogenase family)
MSASLQTVIISGAASGIGRAVALAFAKQGARVGMIDRDEQGLAKVAAEVEANGGEAAIAQAELSNERSVQGVFEKLGFKEIHTVVNNAGIDLAKGIADTEEADLERILAVNLKVPFFLCKQAVPLMVNDGTASIVNVSSAAGLFPIAGRPAYNASKGALISLTRSLALDLAPLIRVNCVCPGAVDTPLLRSSLTQGDGAAEGLDRVVARYPLRRLAQAEEIAEAVLFLASPANRYITGVALAVDGGRTLH